MVTNGFIQVPGKDYGETYLPVIKHASMKLLFVNAARDKMEMHHCDTLTAFLNGVLEEEFCMMQTPGYCVSLKGWFRLQAQQIKLWFETNSSIVV